MVHVKKKKFNTFYLMNQGFYLFSRLDLEGEDSK